MFKFPKISCVTVTAGRVELLKKSIYCYTKQTYPNKELVIVSQGNREENRQIAEHLASLKRQDIQYLEAPQTLTLGAMRNLSIEASTGSIICQWDDDDLSHPFRVMEQYHAMLGNNVVASLYNQHLKYYSDTGKLYWIDWTIERPEWRQYLCGTIMFRKDIFYRYESRLYPEKGDQSCKEEDLNVLIRFAKLGKLAGVSKGYQYIYVYHGNNVYGLEHHNHVLRKRVINGRELLDNKDVLIRTFQEVRMDRPIKVSSLDEVVFEWSPEDAGKPAQL